MSVPKDIATGIHKTIEDATTAVEDVHRAIAAVPFRVIGKVEGLDGPIAEVHELHDRSVGAIYDLVREVNARIGRFTNELLG